MKKSMKLCEHSNIPCHWAVLECPKDVICPQPLPDNDNPLLLGPRTLWWKVQVFLLSPLWLFSLVDTDRPTKSWSEFKYGLIKHEHQWDEDNPEKDQFCTWLNCKHHGCSCVKPIKYS